MRFITDLLHTFNDIVLLFLAVMYMVFTISILCHYAVQSTSFIKFASDTLNTEVYSRDA
jgi:hypothetical protein